MIRLDIVGVADVRERLDLLAHNLNDFDDLWDAVSEIMVDHTEETWDTEGFGTWPPLAPATVEKKEKRGLPPELMVEEYELVESLSGPFAAKVEQGRSTIGTFTTKAFSWGTDVEHAGYHAGGPDHNPALPVREPIIVTPILLLKIEQASEDWAEQMIREAGLSD